MNIRFAFFGTPEISRIILDALADAGFLPSLVVCAPDKPKGRGLEMHEPETKIWAKERGIPVLQPKKLDDEAYSQLITHNWQLFIVCAYGKIIPQRFLDIPSKGNINVHPSLLPKYRGPSPIQAQILNNDTEVGTTIMLMDSLMDHGPILAQKKIALETPQRFNALLKILADESAVLLVETLPKYLNGEITPQEQAHDQATICKMIKKEDGLLDLQTDPYQNYLKFLALNPWPGTYYFQEKNNEQIRIKITDAEFADGKFVIKKIIPEGKREMSYSDFMRNF
jgi:methionyl-tRNA formyltransferase